MDFLDDEADASGPDVQVPSSQNEETERPRKRRRVNRPTISDEADDYDLPSVDYTEDEYDDPDEVLEKSKYDEVMYVPQHASTQKEIYVTQLTQPWSSPTRIRGPRWQRQKTPQSPTARIPDPPAIVRQPRTEINSPGATAFTAPVQDAGSLEVDFEDEDPDLLEAFINAERMQHRENDPAPHPADGRAIALQPTQGFRQTTLFGMPATQRSASATQAARSHNWPLANRPEKPTHHEIDLAAMKTWVYPTNLGKTRDYQFNIVHKGLFHNLLVALPTGLGKTFIAATVMLNWYRWTKNAQIVFVAPTKPLVAQQIEACFHIAGIPRSQTTLLTGEISPSIRAEEWQEKRVFFMTPQTLINDLKSGFADPKKIVLLVVDEAHKATGGYAYVEVVKFMQRFSAGFRVLALTATPGSTVESVQKVVDGLNIARIEIRTEDSMDIRQFVHSREENLELFDYSMEIEEALELFKKAAQPSQNRLCGQQAYWGKDPIDNTVFGLKMAQDEWNKSSAGRSADWKVKAPIFNIFKVLMKLAHGIELLKFHGIGPFYHKMKLFQDDPEANKYYRDISESRPFLEMMQRIKTWVNLPDFVGHPKLSYLKTVTLNHFLDAGEGRGAAGGRPPSETRIMVFAHYRDSAEEIVRVLKQHEPMVRAHIFVGQSSTKGSEGMDQKTQQKIIGQFKTGTYNVLVATSIGEEGLDIGEVDLIICYDASKSPIRMLQRMGRTGRKRAGNVHILLMRGKEERDFAKAKDNYRKMQELIESGRDFTFHEDTSMRIVPKEIQPVVDKRVVEIPVENTQDVSIEPKKRKPKNAKKPPKRFNMPDGVETGFQYLGNSKNKSKTTAVAPPRLDTTDAVVPPLEEVLLTSIEEVERQTRYGEVSGNSPQFVSIPAFEKHSRPFRRLTRTSTVGHSRAADTVAQVYKNVRTRGENCTRPVFAEVMKDFGVSGSGSGSGNEDNVSKRKVPKSSKVAQKTQSKAKKPPRRPRSRSSSRTSSPDRRNTDEDDGYAEMGSFIDDASQRDKALAPSTGATSPDTLSGNLGVLGKTVDDEQIVEEEPFWVSQNRADDRDSDDEEELPDIGDILGAEKGGGGGKGKGRARRRVVESDDEDE